MRIINIIRDVQPIRMGVIIAAVNAAEELYEKFNVTTELWFQGPEHGFSFKHVTLISLKSRSINYLDQLLISRKLNPSRDIIISHSPWGFQSAWGSHLKRKGFNWVFSPHGTLEPWSLSQKWLKKKIYWLFFEKKRLSHADYIWSHSTPERENMIKLFPGKKHLYIPTGIEVSEDLLNVRTEKPVVYLFLARLHHKKGVIPLIKAWMLSELHSRKDVKLVVAGPDDGELHAVQELIKKAGNIEYAGAVYGEKKAGLLMLSTFVVLPSYSEGFPMSIVEAAEKGLIPVISTGVNFPEIVQEILAVPTGTSVEEIKKALEHCNSLTPDEIKEMSAGVHKFIKANYNIQKTASMQYHSFKTILTGN